jgi:hypothetical protein
MRPPQVPLLQRLLRGLLTEAFPAEPDFVARLVGPEYNSKVHGFWAALYPHQPPHAGAGL